MKNAQRCWMVKAVLASVPRGGRLVEIGAGEPLVAGLLSRLGYEVIVVDPYDGSGNGPREYSRFTAAYPDLRFVRDQFPPQEDLGGAFDCVYSISVLEHVPLEAIDGVIAGAAELLAERGGCSIHAVDHVLAGWGCGHPPRGDRADRRRIRAGRRGARATRSRRWSSTPRPTWSRPRPTTSLARRGAVRRPTRCAASARWSSSPAVLALERLGDPRRLAVEDGQAEDADADEDQRRRDQAQRRRRRPRPRSGRSGR